MDKCLIRGNPDINSSRTWSKAINLGIVRDDQKPKLANPLFNYTRYII